MPRTATPPEYRLFDLQLRAATARIGALDELVNLTDLAVNNADSLPGLLRKLERIQQQVHATRKTVVHECLAVGFSDKEIARALRLTIDDFRSRFPHKRPLCIERKSHD